jgi:hypothetical protein
MSSRSREGYANEPEKKKTTAHTKDKPLAEEDD